jgi:hypothetical protein
VASPRKQVPLIATILLSHEAIANRMRRGWGPVHLLEKGIMRAINSEGLEATRGTDRRLSDTGGGF